MEHDQIASTALHQSAATMQMLQRAQAQAAFLETHGDAILPDLLAGIRNGDNPVTKCDKLIQNFAKISFSYTIAHATAPASFLSGTLNGTCETLAGAFKLICTEHFGIAAQNKSADNFLVQNTNRTIDGGTPPNACRGTLWAFDTHVWVEAAGKAYDPLFGAVLNQSDWLTLDSPAKEDDTHKLTIEVYGGERFYTGYFGNTDPTRKLTRGLDEELYKLHRAFYAKTFKTTLPER